MSHGHEHEGASEPHSHLTSVGIDIGSSTSHLMFSELAIGYPSVHRRRPEILERRVIARSPVMLTPFSGDWNIQAEPLAQLIDESFSAAGLNRDDIDTGAVIITGEAARRENAQKIAELFSAQAGQFVCATAGPRLEALLAAHGSGAVGRSLDEALTLLNVDIGGGTTKVTLVEKGRVAGITALNIGARLIALNGGGRIARLEESGKRILRSLGLQLSMGDAVDAATLERVAREMAQLLFDTLATGEAAWNELMVLAPIGKLPAIDGIVFSGGVSEYIYGRERGAFGDLGPLLGREARTQAERLGFTLFDSSEGIRATVIGASQYSMQVSGETIFIPDPKMLPLHNLRVVVVRVDWNAPVAANSEKAIRAALDATDAEVRATPFALVFVSPPFVGYGAAQDLAGGIRAAVAPLPADERPRMLVFEQNVGRVIGESLADFGLPCVDEVALGELDFIDVGRLVEAEGYVPVVIKSLAFGA
ncbi:MAG TPA: ethanolamine ammonia-lyase reactivating factor EutA [Candidatus Binatia bacterium]|jgi:ethanolamine utilization protein EutA